jgi:rod shape-determining protein MreD
MSFSRNMLLLLAIWLLYFVQIHASLPFGRAGIRPDLLFCFVLYVGITFTPCRGGLLCFCTGYCFELFSGAHSGMYASLYLCLFIMVLFLKRFFSFDSPAELFFLFAAGMLLRLIFLHGAFVVVYESRQSLLLLRYLNEALYTAVLYPFVFAGLCAMYRDPRTSQETYTTLSNVRRV